ncbi:glycosyltransferase [Mycobacterium sp. LTG2003]
MPSYRQEFVRALEESGEDVLFLVGDRQFGDAVVTDVESPIVRKTGRNVYLMGRKLVWQPGCLVRGFLAKNLIIELNPRNLTSWLLLLVRLLTFRQVSAWGHAHSRRGSNPEYNRPRRFMQGLCAELITYTESEAAELMTCFPDKPITPARNSLYSAAQLAAYTIPDVDQRSDLIIIGRLVADKKPLLGLAAFERALPFLPDQVSVHVVGAGPQEDDVRAYVSAAGLTGRVQLHGWVSELSVLAPIFQRCRGLLSPGYVGLNVTQALGFGLPVIYPRDDPHAPEIEALNSTNSIVFDTDDVDQCSRAIIALYQDNWLFDTHRMADDIRSQYSTERMVRPFVALARRS